jgi:transcriptional regulator with XRE-family HTH domain
MEIGKRIEKLLIQTNISQRELANRIGLDESTISRIIKGERTPKSDVLANIATALHTTSDYLLGIENEEFDSSKIIRLIARNSSKMTEVEKKNLINALFEEE